MGRKSAHPTENRQGMKKAHRSALFNITNRGLFKQAAIPAHYAAMDFL
ncbi:hypothetical protein [Collimonas pratensis]|uniref:Uncharacterized protein n=1 Tax=Collimonas pratensis TaxID=279113 RepID=A0ABM5Z4Q4_9BURK|nr:hypothetical protein [Collimonas pratensis]AMP14141.1 hypothetical protein CPter291_1874 [Collimonas pratensis]